MKKMVKISCVAALALASLQVVSAKPLSEAVKGVDVSGSVAYRYDESNLDKGKDAGTSATNGYKAALNVKAPINKYIKVNTRFLVGGDSLPASGLIKGSGSAVQLSTNGSGDANPTATLAQANFEVNVGMVKAIVGKQGLTTPWTVATSAYGNEQDGTGGLFFVNTKYATVAAGYFNQTNLVAATDDKTSLPTFGINGSNDIYTAAVIVPVGGFAIDAWYLNMADAFNTYTVGINGSQKVAGIKLGLDARYTGLTLDDKTGATGDAQDNSLAKIVVTGKSGIVGAKLAYAMTGKNGGTAALDNDAQTDLQGWNVHANGMTDASMYLVNVNADLITGMNIAVNYDSLSYGTGNDKGTNSEYYAQLNYNMGKNLKTYLRYGQETMDPDAGTKVTKNRGRIQVAYLF